MPYRRGGKLKHALQKRGELRGEGGGLTGGSEPVEIEVVLAQDDGHFLGREIDLDVGVAVTRVAVEGDSHARHA